MIHTQKAKKHPLGIPKDNHGGRLKTFMELVGRKNNIQFKDYWQFHQWTVDNISKFWAEFCDNIGIVFSKKHHQVIDESIPMENCPKWFEGARLNFAENMLKYRDDKVALVVTGEANNTERVTYRQMYEETRQYAAALRKIGIKKGDRVSCLMPNRKEAIIAMLAATSIGAIWATSTTALGAKGFISRMKSIKPRVLFTVDQYQFNKKVINLLQGIQEIENDIPCLEKIIIIPAKPESKLKDVTGIKKGCDLKHFLQMACNADGSVPVLEFEQMSLSDPVFVLYTSGTTGSPKAIIHGSGVLLSRLRDYYLHWNVERSDVWLTTTAPGWSVWNGFSMILCLGATLLVFDGLPYFLSNTYLWNIIDEEKITVLSITANALDELEKRKYLPTEKHDLRSLKMILVYGNVVMPHMHDFVLTKVKRDVIFSVMYAATDIMSSFAVTELTLPMHRGEISSISLGVAAAILDETGNSVTDKEGEFVLLKSIPSMPLGFWDDKDGREFKENYFSKYPGKFTLGDVALINPVTHGLTILGRSNESMRPCELFMRSCQIYDAISELSEIRDAICVAQYKKDIDQRVVLFVKMQEGYSFNENVVQKIQKSVEQKLTEKYIPEVITAVPDIPYNVNGKKMESMVRRIINNMPVNTEMLSNPECLKYFYDNPNLRDY